MHVQRVRRGDHYQNCELDGISVSLRQAYQGKARAGEKSTVTRSITSFFQPAPKRSKKDEPTVVNQMRDFSTDGDFDDDDDDDVFKCSKMVRTRTTTMAPRRNASSISSLPTATKLWTRMFLLNTVSLLLLRGAFNSATTRRPESSTKHQARRARLRKSEEPTEPARPVLRLPVAGPASIHQ